MILSSVTTSDPLQPGYTYQLSLPPGKGFDPDFTPDLSPPEMLALGVFDGNYFDGFTEEFPPEWFANIPQQNYFGISASQPLSVWQANGWIYPEDPRGWFQWYCRYYLGRRLHQEDQRQIRRWRAMRRHLAQLKKACRPGDSSCRPKQRQALLHWGYDTRTA
ncbi:MAG: hypothetical protein WCO52_03420 [bacterium]